MLEWVQSELIPIFKDRWQVLFGAVCYWVQQPLTADILNFPA